MANNHHHLLREQFPQSATALRPMVKPMQQKEGSSMSRSTTTQQGGQQSQQPNGNQSTAFQRLSESQTATTDQNGKK
jgi:glutathionylspermidine synthase